MDENPSIEIRMLGPFRVVVDGRTVAPTAWRSQKAKLMLKYLASRRGNKVPRDSLIELLWPGEATEAAVGRLYTTLHFLRRAVEPDLPRYGSSSLIHARGGLYWCADGGKVWVDSEAFEDLYERALAAEASSQNASREEALALLQEALGLYQGNFLEEDHGEDWTVLHREALLDKFVDASLRAARLHYELTGDAGAAAQFCRDALHHDRFREELYQDLIKYLLAADRPGEAAMQYRTLHTVLRDEFALEPSASTAALLKQRGIEALRGMAGKTPPPPKLVRRLPRAERAPAAPEGEGAGPLVVDRATFRTLREWNERVSERYLTAFSVLTLMGGGVTPPLLERLLARLEGELRNSDVIALDGRRVLVLLPFMERAGANVVVRRLVDAAQNSLGLRLSADVEVVAGRRLASSSHG